MPRPSTDFTDAPIGLVIALETEAKAVLGRGRFHEENGLLVRRGTASGAEWVCVLSGVGPGRAYKAAQGLASMGVPRIGSVGVSGGLEPRLRAGTVIVGTVCREHIPGKVPTTVWEADGGTDGPVECLDKARVPVTPGRLVTVPAPALTSEAKKFLRKDHDALAVDMESSAVARAAVESGVGFFVLRAICDDAEREIPPEVMQAVSEAGNADFGRIIGMILKKPSLLPKLMAMGREYNKALKSLTRSFKALSKAGFRPLFD